MILAVVLGIVGIMVLAFARKSYPVTFYTQSTAGGWFHKLLDDADGDKVSMHIWLVSIGWACIGAAAMRIFQLKF